MDLLISIFNTVLYQPLFNILVLLYQYLPGRDFGVAVIVLTIIIRLISYPLMVQAIKSQKILIELQPKIQEIQQKYKNDKEKQVRATMELYQKEKINPFGGCLPLLIQLPILIALYQVFWKGLQPEAMVNLYNFVPHPGSIDPTFLGVINLSQASLTLAILAGISQFFQTKMVTPKTSKIKKDQGPMAQFSEMLQKQMLYFFPIFTVYILSPLSPWKLPAALGLYWFINTLFSIFQQYLVFAKRTPID